MNLSRAVLSLKERGIKMKKFLILASMLVFSFSVFSMLARADIVRDGLVSYWNFDNIVGDTVEDDWGNNDGTIFGDPEIVEGKFGKALKFDGQDDYVEIPDSDSLDGMSGISVLLWANVETLSDVAGTDQSLINKDAAGWGARLYRIYLDQPTNTIHWRVGDGAGSYVVHCNGQTVLEDSQWYHIAGVSDLDGAFAYIDGIEDGAFAGFEVPDNDTTLRIGRAHTDNYGYIGVIDEVAIYDRALSADEIEQNFAAEGLAVTSLTDKLPITWGKIKASSQ